MKARVCQHFEVFQHEFANFSLPCEGRLKDRLRIISITCTVGKWSLTTSNNLLAGEYSKEKRSFIVASTAFLSLPLTKTNKFNIEGDRAKERRGLFQHL